MAIEPDGILGIYDNNGESMDRYSIHIEYEDGTRMLLCSSPDPRGISSRADSHQYDIGDHLGKEIEWGALPKLVQDWVVAELNVPN